MSFARGCVTFRGQERGETAMTRPEIARLRSFTRWTDRQLTPFFAGRVAERHLIHGRIEDVAQQAFEGHSIMPAEGQTLLITGAPGAGKTALARKVGDHLHEHGGGIVLPLALETLADPMDLRKALEAQFSPDRLRLVLEKTVDLLRRAGAALPAALSAAIDGPVAEVAASVMAHVVGATIKKQGHSKFELPCPVVLFIDEIQVINPSVHARECAALRNLHLGIHGQPILPLLVGLATARDRLSDAGLSRLSADSIITLGCLSGDEAALSARAFCADHRVQGDTDSWTQKIADWSDGWPMHVHNTLRAIAEQLVTQADQRMGTGDPAIARGAHAAIGHLDHIDEMAIRRRAAHLRADYYSARLSGPLSECDELIAHLIHRVERSMKKSEIRRLIHEDYPRFVQDQPWLADSLPVSDLFDQMLRRGLLQLTADAGEDLYDCPIPSLRNYCVLRAASRLHVRAYLGDLDGVQDELNGGGDAMMRDLCGRTAADVAAEEGWTALHAGFQSFAPGNRPRQAAGTSP